MIKSCLKSINQNNLISQRYTKQTIIVLQLTIVKTNSPFYYLSCALLKPEKQPRKKRHSHITDKKDSRNFPEVYLQQLSK